jgi:hypothetical protein
MSRLDGHTLVESTMTKIALRASLNLRQGDAYKIIDNYQAIDEGTSNTLDAWFVVKKVDALNVEFVVVDKYSRLVDGPAKMKKRLFEDVLVKHAKKDGAFYTEEIATLLRAQIAPLIRESYGL